MIGAKFDLLPGINRLHQRSQPKETQIGRPEQQRHRNHVEGEIQPIGRDGLAQLMDDDGTGPQQHKEDKCLAFFLGWLWVGVPTDGLLIIGCLFVGSNLNVHRFSWFRQSGDSHFGSDCHLVTPSPPHLVIFHPSSCHPYPLTLSSLPHPALTGCGDPVVLACPVYYVIAHGLRTAGHARGHRNRLQP